MISPTLFRTACGRFATGVAIATVIGSDRAHWGLTVNSFSSLSLDPPLVLFSIDRAASCHDIFMAAGSFAINILSAEQQRLSFRFSFVKDEDRFNGQELLPTPNGEPPLLAGCLSHIVCSTENTVSGGDHTILIGRVRHLSVSEDPNAKPLLYYQGAYATLSS